MDTDALCIGGLAMWHYRCLSVLICVRFFPLLNLLANYDIFSNQTPMHTNDFLLPISLNSYPATLHCFGK